MADTEGSSSHKSRRRAAVGAGLATVVLEAVVVGRRRGRLLAVETVVRCRRGHLFTTIWIPGVSFKSVRLGWWRFQRCPVDAHWDFVTPVGVGGLTAEELTAAGEHRDVRIP